MFSFSDPVSLHSVQKCPYKNFTVTYFSQCKQKEISVDIRWRKIDLRNTNLLNNLYKIADFLSKIFFSLLFFMKQLCEVEPSLKVLTKYKCRVTTLHGLFPNEWFHEIFRNVRLKTYLWLAKFKFVVLKQAFWQLFQYFGFSKMLLFILKKKLVFVALLTSGTDNLYLGPS